MLEQLGWVGGIAFESFGVRLGVRVNSLDLLDRVRECLPPGWQPTSSGDVEHLFSLRVGAPGPLPELRSYGFLHGDRTLLGQSMDLSYLLHLLESEIQLYIAEWAPGHIFVHAGVVGHRGQALLLPGRSFAGKSTLVAELLRAGAPYYSDEYAVLNPDGRVLPYPRRLALRDATTGTRTRCAPGELGSQPGTEPTPIGLVVLAHYRAGASWRPRSLSRARTVLEVMEHAVPARRRPRATLTAIEAAVRGATCLKGVRGEARETAAALLHNAF
jgi:hypothetical protein